MKTPFIYYFTLCAAHMMCVSCEGFLEAKADLKIATPENLNDLQLILDEYATMNNNFPNAGEVMADNYYLLEQDWASLAEETHRNLYIWQADENTNDYWDASYRAILNANIILDKLQDLKYAKDDMAYATVKGAALFYRGYRYLALAGIFAEQYVPQSADTCLGLPLRMDSDFNKPSTRSTLSETYQLIISDLKTSADLLPEKPSIASRPGKAAAYGAMARTYLVMGDYHQSLLYADSCLQLHDVLMDYNELNVNSASPILRFNEEVIFQARSQTTPALARSRAKIDSVLYASYDEYDLRRNAFFSANGDGSYAFKGGYDGLGTNSGYVFAGIVSDEVYLIKAECLARIGQPTQAMAVLNTLLSVRWQEGYFSPIVVSDAEEALRIILRERRKELLFRGIRWIDLKRLHLGADEFDVPRRVINGQVYMAISGGSAYTMRFPRNVIERSGMPQNQ